MLGKNDLYEALIRIGNRPDTVWANIMEKLHQQQPEGIMLYEEQEWERGIVVMPVYEYRLCCPVHPPHEYDLEDPDDIGLYRHGKWRAEQTNNLHFQRLEEEPIMDRWRVHKNWRKFGGLIPDKGYIK